MSSNFYSDKRNEPLTCGRWSWIVDIGHNVKPQLIWNTRVYWCLYEIEHTSDIFSLKIGDKTKH